MTGTTFTIIHSGLFVMRELASRKLSTTCKRFNASLLRC